MYIDINSLEGLCTEPLGNGRSILVSKRHRFGTDAFLLAQFCAPRKKERAVDIGTGCGIIPTLWLGRRSVASVLGIDISAEACALAQQTAILNGDTEQMTVLCADIRTLGARRLDINTDDKSTGAVQPEREQFDLVVCNPPYFTGASGYISPEPERAQARAELECSVEDVCTAARYLLRYGGRLCMCQRPERLVDVMCAMRSAGIEPKRLRMVQQKPESKPWLFLIEGRRGGASTLDILPPLFMLSADGSSSAEIEEMYGCYRDGRGWK